jgi:hypothetical protein
MDLATTTTVVVVLLLRMGGSWRVVRVGLPRRRLVGNDIIIIIIIIIIIPIRTIRLRLLLRLLLLLPTTRKCLGGFKCKFKCINNRFTLIGNESATLAVRRRLREHPRRPCLCPARLPRVRTRTTSRPQPPQLPPIDETTTTEPYATPRVSMERLRRGGNNSKSNSNGMMELPRWWGTRTTTRERSHPHPRRRRRKTPARLQRTHPSINNISNDNSNDNSNSNSTRPILQRTNRSRIMTMTQKIVHPRGGG